MAASAPDPAAHQAEELAHVRRTWDRWGRQDPLWAVLSLQDRRGERWDVDEFLATGREHVAWMLRWLGENEIEVPRTRWLDVGCGVGRLTQALAEHADRVDGIDIAPSMIERARALAAGRDGITFHVGSGGDLRTFDDASFDLVCSFLVLQHIPTEIALGYVAEFVRVLRPGGVAVFGAPSEYSPASVESYALPPDACRAALSLERPPRLMAAGATAEVEVGVTNRSRVAWPSATEHEGGLGGITVGNHWSTRNGRVVTDDGRSALPCDVAPGQTVRIALRVTAPSRPGVYGLEVDLVQEGICWFGDKGSPLARRRVLVARTRRARGVTPAPPREGAVPPISPAPVFGMYPLPESRVRAAVAASGGSVAAVLEEPGDGWRSLRYAVIRQG